MKTVLGLLVFLGISAACLADSQPVVFYAQLIRATDREGHEPGWRPIGPKLTNRLCPKFRWNHFWEVSRQTLNVEPGKKTRVRLNPEREIEIELRGDIIRKKNFNWNLAANISGNRSKVTKINQDFQDPNSVGYTDPFYQAQFAIGNTILREGEPIGLIYGYRFKGVINSQKELDDYKKNSLYAQYGILSNLTLGYPMYELIDTGTYKGYWKRDVIGSAQPKFFGGITNTFNYKQFSIIALLSFSYGGELLYLPDVKSLGLGERSNRNTRILLPHYTAATPEEERPSLLLTESNRFGTGSSDLAVHDASYLKLKSITLNYQLPEKLLSKIHIRTAMIYASGINLFCLTDYPGPDPEVSNDPYSLINGYSDPATYPSARQYSVGLRLGF